jgi:trans-aconitate 2-methyltransferase
MNETPDVKGFYEQFAGDVLLGDFRRFNLRHEAIRDLCRRFVTRGSRVLEVGCGVGIISKFLQSLDCRVVGVDISENNIRIAEAYAGSRNCEFMLLDVVEDTGRLAPLGVFDAILLPDVIEHIPKARYPELFKALEGVLCPSGRVLLTFPSPGYQEHLKAHHPERLQVVDETVELDDIMNATSLELHYFARRDVWKKNQYTHMVIASGRAFDPAPVEMRFLERLRYRIMKRLWRIRNRPFVAKQLKDS